MTDARDAAEKRAREHNERHMAFHSSGSCTPAMLCVACANLTDEFLAWGEEQRRAGMEEAKGQSMTGMLSRAMEQGESLGRAGRREDVARLTEELAASETARDTLLPEGAAVPAAPPENGPLGHRFQQPDTKREPLLSSDGLCAHWYRVQDKGPKRGYCARPFCDHWPLAPLAGEAEEPKVLKSHTLGDVVKGRYGLVPRVKCDGEHGGPRCADPECWNDEAKPEPAPEPTLIDHPYEDCNRPGEQCHGPLQCHRLGCYEPRSRHKAAPEEGR